MCLKKIEFRRFIFIFIMCYLHFIFYLFYTTDSAEASNLGHNSAHYLAMGTRIVDPFISPLLKL